MDRGAGPRAERGDHRCVFVPWPGGDDTGALAARARRKVVKEVSRDATAKVADLRGARFVPGPIGRGASCPYPSRRSGASRAGSSEGRPRRRSVFAMGKRSWRLPFHRGRDWAASPVPRPVGRPALSAARDDHQRPGLIDLLQELRVGDGLQSGRRDPRGARPGRLRQRPAGGIR